MRMIGFRISDFLFDKRISQTELAKIMKQPTRSIGFMIVRGTVKPSFIKKLESKYGDLSEYIIKETMLN